MVLIGRRVITSDTHYVSTYVDEQQTALRE